MSKNTTMESHGPSQISTSETVRRCQRNHDGQLTLIVISLLIIFTFYILLFCTYLLMIIHEVQWEWRPVCCFVNFYSWYVSPCEVCNA